MDREETKKENLDWYSSYVWFYDFATWKFRIRGTSVRQHQQNKIPSLSLSPLLKLSLLLTSLHMNNKRQTYISANPKLYHAFLYF